MRCTSRIVLLLCFLSIPLLAHALADEAPEPPQQPAALTLENAVQSATGASADVITARSDLAQAESAQRTSLADPLAIRLEQLQAGHAVEAAEAALRSTLLRARTDATAAYVAALEAADALAVAELEHEIAVTSLEAQQLRFSAGAITALDLERARNSLQLAASNLQTARTSRELSQAELASLTGRTTELSAVDGDVGAEALAAVQEVLEQAWQNNMGILAAGRALELATARLAAVDNAFTSKQETDAARAAVSAAELRVAEARRALELTLQGNHNAVQSAQARLAGMSTALETARTEHEAQAARYEAGTISLLAFRQASVALENAAAAERSALHALLLARLRLEQAVLGQ
jgi:outer membrane protein TolC